MIDTWSCGILYSHSLTVTVKATTHPLRTKISIPVWVLSAWHVMQNVESIFEVDTIRNIMLHVSEIAGIKYNDNEETDVSLRVITDHIDLLQ